MKKLLLGSLTILLIFALTSWATDTRVMTMGDANNIVKDDANIWLYPSTVVNYGGLAIGEFCTDLGPWEFERLGMNFGCSKSDRVFGLYLSRVPDMMYSNYGPNVLDPDGGSAGVDHKLDLFFGTPMGDNQFGARLSFYSDSWSVDRTSPDDQSAASNMMLDFAAGLTLNENTDLAVNFGITTFTNEDADGNMVTEPDGGMHFGIGGRHWMDFGGDYVGVPHAGFMYSTEGFTDSSSLSNGEKVNTMAFDLGWGMNLMPDNDILVVGDFGFMYLNEKTTTTTAGTEAETTMSGIVLPYFGLGLEGNVTSWWDVRVGARKYWTMVSADITDDWTEKWGFAETTTYLGSSVHFGNLELDVEVDPGFVQRGPYLASGQNGNIANRVSLVYNFGGE